MLCCVVLLLLLLCCVVLCCVVLCCVVLCCVVLCCVVLCCVVLCCVVLCCVVVVVLCCVVVVLCCCVVVVVYLARSVASRALAAALLRHLLLGNCCVHFPIMHQLNVARERVLFVEYFVALRAVLGVARVCVLWI